MPQTQDLAANLADQIAIAELTARYNNAHDEGRADEYVGVFLEDGEMEITGGPTFSGREALSGLIHPGSKFIRHVTANPIIEIDGDTATQRVRLLTYAVAEDGSGVTFTGTGKYFDELVRTEDGWRFKKRTVTLDMTPNL